MKNHKKSLPRKLLAYILAVAMVFSVLVSVAVSVNAADGYQLVWSDEFDGAGVNPYNWTLDQGVRNGSGQIYTLNNARTENGKLIVKGECTVVDKNGNVMPDHQVSKYTKDLRSASLETNGKQAFKFGKVEIRAKLPNACSAWPAFWTCGYDKYGMDRKQGGSSWPCNGEIDFMEMMCVNSNNEPTSPRGKKNKDKEYEVHLHQGHKYIKGTGELWDGDVNADIGYSDFPIDPGAVNDSEQLAAKWHTYGMIWEKDRIYITFDGAVKITIDTSNAALLQKAANRVGTGSNEYKAYKKMLETYGNPYNDYEHYFLIDFAIGGGGTENRFYNDEWPQNLAIDYIRVYQKNDGVSTHNATINAGTTYNVNGKTYTTYNHWAGKGLTKGSAIPANWVADPKYGGQKVTESDTIPTDKPASSSTPSSSSSVSTQKPTSGVTIDFDNVTAELEKVGGIAANNASSDSTSINSGKSFKTYAWTGSVSDFTTYYAALNISPHIAENANSLSFKSLAVHDNTGSTALAQYGLTIDGKNYWSGSKASDTNGVINSTVQTISVVGKTLYATDGTQKTITAVDIPKITKFLVKPTTTETAIYVDDIAIGVGGSSTSSSSSSVSTQKPTSGVTIDFDSVTATMDKIGTIAANNASGDSTSINSGKSFKTYASASASVSDFNTSYAALNISPHIATNANSLSFKSLAVHDSTGTALAQYGLTIDGKNYWSGSKANDTNGVINSTVQTISVVGKTLYASDGTSKTITASDIPKITKFLVKPTTTESKIYVDDIVIGVGGSSTSSSSGSSGETLNGDVILDWSNFNGYSGTGFNFTKDSPTGYIHVSGNKTLGSSTQIADLLNWWNWTPSGYDKIQFTVYGKGNVRLNYGGTETASTTLSSTPKTITINVSDFANTNAGDIKFQLDAGAKGATVDVDLYISDVYGYKGSGEEPSTTPELSLTMSAGASIRLGSANGIRFTTNVNETQLSNLKSNGYTVELGTLIAPADLIDGELTLDTALKINVPYNADLVDGTIRGSIINIQESNNYNKTSGNIARTFIGRGYAKITKDGVTTVVYATQNTEGRSLAQVASLFKADAEKYSAVSDAHKALVDKWAAFYDTTV